jgi:NAD-dependent SIR2 family protein deacetylase
MRPKPFAPFIARFSSTSMNDPVDVLAARIAAAHRVTILTGAGVSAPSGIPTFRGAEGLWRDFRPEDLATPDAFRRNPGLVWDWYAWRRGTIASCSPNPAHDVIARWSQSGRCTVTVITQNVDDLHVRARHTEPGPPPWVDLGAAVLERVPGRTRPVAG